MALYISFLAPISLPSPSDAFHNLTHFCLSFQPQPLLHQPLHTLLLPLLLLLLSLLFLLWGQRQKAPGSGKHKGSAVGGPRVYPVLGLLPEIVRNAPRFYDWISDTLQSCPSLTFSATTLGLREVYTANPKNIQHILKDNFPNYPKGPDLTYVAIDFLGHGIFASDGEDWWHQRKTASLEFSTNSMRRLIASSVHKEIQERLFPTLDAAVERGAAVDIQDILLRFTFDNICRVGFGYNPGCLCPDLPIVPFANAFDTAARVTMQRIMMPTLVWRVMRALSIGQEQELKIAMQSIVVFVDAIIEKRLKLISQMDEQQLLSAQGQNSVTKETSEEPTMKKETSEDPKGKGDTSEEAKMQKETSEGAAKEEEKPEEAAEGAKVKKEKSEEARVKRDTAEEPAAAADYRDLLSRFILLNEKSRKKGEGGSEKKNEDRVLRDMCLNFMLAARDTSAVTLSWFLWVLSSHPHVEEKILEEVEHIISMRGTQGDKEEPLSMEETSKMKYTHAALNETLRLYPAVPMDFKEAAGDDVLPDGTMVRKRTRMNYVVYAQGRAEQVWGSDAKEFKPERWLTPEGDVKQESPYKFTAFNAGPRLCLGKDMAYIQMKCIAGSLLRKYKLVLSPDNNVQYNVSLVMTMKAGLKVFVHPR